MPKFAVLLASLFLLSCNSPEARLERLQHDFWEKFARQDFFEIKLKNEVLHLPLPPSSEHPEQQKSWAENLQKEANALEKEKLSMTDLKQLTQIQAALNDCVVHEGTAFFDPSHCTVTAHLQQLSTQPDLLVFLENIPAYYALLEQRWQMPDLRYVSKAVEESQIALDLLNEMEEKSGREIVARTGPARAAVKDFIGLCQSALLGNGTR